MASQLMADETERSSSLSSSEPRRPRMKRPNGDWRRLPRERDRWRRLPRDDLGDCLGTQAVACPGAVVDMVEPMVFFSFGCFFQVLERPRSACCSRRRRRNPFAGASVAERLYWGRWVSGRAVLRLCAPFGCATAVKGAPAGGWDQKVDFQLAEGRLMQLFGCYAPQGTSRSSAASLALNEPAQAAL